MNAVILAGGVRSGPESTGPALPRPLWPFPSAPLIATVIAFLRHAGLHQLALCANGNTPMIAAALAAYPGPHHDLHYAEDRFPRGPAGCLKDLEPWLGPETFLVVQGTAWYDFDLPAMLADHHATNAAITVGAIPGPPPAHPLIPAGVYLLQPAVLALIHPVGYQDLKEQLLPRALAAGLTVRSHTLAGRVELIHGPDHYLNALAHAIPRAARQHPHDMRQLAPDVWVHPSAHLAPHTRLSGPLWIDHHAHLGESAVIMGPAILGPHVTIGASALLHRVALLPGTKIPAQAQLTNALLGPHSLCPAPTLPPQPQPEPPPTSTLSRRIRLHTHRALTLLGLPRRASLARAG